MVGEVTEQSDKYAEWIPRKTVLLLVEGEDDKAFFEALIDYLSLQDIQVEHLKGKTKWKRKLMFIKNRPEFQENVKSLGLVRDADTSPKDAFSSIAEALREAKLSIPQKPLESKGTNPKVTVLILPDENEEGMLEDLCLKSVESDPAIPCITKFFECLQQTGLTLPSNLCKHKVQAFLSSRQHEVIGIRRASKMGCWKWENVAFQKVKDFLSLISAL